MADIGMPVGLTFAGRAYDDSNLLRLASAFEATGSKRQVPPRTPALTAGTRRVGLRLERVSIRSRLQWPVAYLCVNTLQHTLPCLATDSSDSSGRTDRE
jgi:hypothetical protein